MPESSRHKSFSIAVLPGDGIGPEVTAEAVRVLRAIAEVEGVEFAFHNLPFGGRAVDDFGDPFPQETIDCCLRSDAVLLGAVGGAKWDNLSGAQRPESGLLRLRKTLNLFANLRPVRVTDRLARSSALRPSEASGVDMLVVRELTSGIYFGPSDRGESGGVKWAQSTMRYDTDEITRIAKVAFEQARRRRGRVVSVDKANVLEVSRLWRETVARVHKDGYPDVELDHAYVDSSAVRLVTSPRDFDVILTSNLFGDILSDVAAAIPGSLGVLPSASVGSGDSKCRGVFEPVHGSAPDIAGEGIANPIGIVLSTAMMLDELGLEEAASAIREAVDAVIDDGIITPDLTAPGTSAASTTDVGHAIADRVTEMLASAPATGEPRYTINMRYETPHQ